MITQEEFIKYLDEKSVSLENKLDVINYFMHNYPVNTKVGHQMTMSGIQEVKEWTSLKLLNLNITSLERPDLINRAYNSLAQRIEELKKFKQEND